MFYSYYTSTPLMTKPYPENYHFPDQILDYFEQYVIEFKDFESEIFHKGFVLDQDGIWFYDKSLSYNPEVNHSRPYVTIFKEQKILDVERNIDEVILKREIALFFPLDYRFQHCLIPLFVSEWLSPQRSESYYDTEVKDCFGVQKSEKELSYARDRNIRGYSFPSYIFTNDSMTSKDILQAGLFIGVEMLTHSSFAILHNKKQDKTDDNYSHFMYVRVTSSSNEHVMEGTNKLSVYFNIDPDIIHQVPRVSKSIRHTNNALLENNYYELGAIPYHEVDEYNFTEFCTMETKRLLLYEELEKWYIKDEHLHVLKHEENHEDPTLQFYFDPNETIDEDMGHFKHTFKEKVEAFFGKKFSNVLTLQRFCGQINQKIRYILPCYSESINTIIFVESPYFMFCGK